MKMRDISAVALFCDDIREEVSGAHSLIGVLGDNIVVPSFPGAVAKLGIYVRLHIPVDFSACKFDIILEYPNGTNIKVAEVNEILVEKTIKDAKISGNRIAGIYSKLIASPFPVSEAGRIIVKIKYNGHEYVIGAINFLTEDKSA